MNSVGYQMVMTYYRMMREIRARVEIGPKQVRFYMDKLSILSLPPINCSVRSYDFGGVKVEGVKHRDAEDDLILFFIHGGAFAFGSARTHRAAAAFLSKHTKARVYLPEYRTTPEYHYPCPLEDCIKSYSAIVEKYPNKKIIAVGDSAGGNLCAALTVYCRDNQLPLPYKLVLMSPWLDLTPESASIQKNNDSESIFDTKDLMDYAEYYLAGKSAKDPLVSPYYANVQDFPPTFIQVASNELLYADSLGFAEKLQAEGVACELDVEENLFHSWQLLSDYLPAARRSLENVSKFILAETK